MKLQVSSSLIGMLDGLRANLTHYYLLHQADQGILDMSSEASLQMLTRKGWAVVDKTDKTIHLTTEGKALFTQLQEEANKGQTDTLTTDGVEIKQKAKGVIKKIRGIKAAGFASWWSTFPATTTWTNPDTGTKWHGGRTLRLKKDNCEAKYNDWLLRGASEERMLEILQWQIKTLQDQSLQKSENCMQYFSNTEAYLNKKNYDDLLEAMEIDRKESKPTEIQELLTIRNNDFL